MGIEGFCGVMIFIGDKCEIRMADVFHENPLRMLNDDRFIIALESELSMNERKPLDEIETKCYNGIEVM